MDDALFDLSRLNGTNGFVVNGIDSYDRAGYSVSSAGDINGDGLDDIIISTNNIDPNSDRDPGISYVIFGSRNRFSSSLNLSELDGNNGFSFNASDTEDFTRFLVSSAGDINGDEVDDLLISGVTNGYDSGTSYVVFGSRNEFPRSLDLSELDESNGFTINGINAQDRFGFSVSDAGDINGDGLGDIIIGARYASPDGNRYAGASYVVFGDRNGFDGNFDLATLDGSNGFVINGINSLEEDLIEDSEQSGFSVSGAGDINGDGLDDIIVGAPFASVSVDEMSTGKSYVVFGSRNEFSSSLDLSELDGSNGFTINGINAQDRFGFSVSDAGDINGDGLGDIVIGARYASPDGNQYAGASYVVFGDRDEFDSNFDLATLDGNNGFAISGIDPTDFSGEVVSSAGDINNDGFDDIIVGASVANDNLGESYVIFGSNNEFPSNLSLSSLDGNNGFTIAGIDPTDQFGNSVSAAGDINGDEIDDLIIGASTADPNGNESAGESYVIFGSDTILEDNDIIELYRFRNTTFDTGTYVFVGEKERDAILANPDFNQIFELEGNGNPAFRASTVPGENLLPFFRLRSLAVPGTFLFVSTGEYNSIFAENSPQRNQWIAEGLDESDEDIPEFYLFGTGSGQGEEFNRFQNKDNSTFVFAGPDETRAILANPSFLEVFDDQGAAFESL